MKARTILFIVAWALYAVATFVLFPRFNSNVGFPAILFTGVGSWLFGRSTGLWLLLPMLIHQIALFEYFADEYIYYTDRVIGTVIHLSAIALVGTLKDSLESIRAVNTRLDLAVLERTRELDNLTQKLIEHLETLRISRGQELHDGIGQQLTGIQLYATSLADRLAAEQNVGASLAYSLTTRSRIVHNKIRHACRTLYPMQIREVGLRPALDELASCLRVIKNIEVGINTQGDISSIPPATALQLFRICQETALLVIDRSHAQRIGIGVSVLPSALQLSVEHDGNPAAAIRDGSNEARLINYRLMQVNGSIEILTGDNQIQTLNIAIPKTPGGMAA
ncbi:Sensor histidine kinase LiaS [Pontiella desulfatans]|uniref:histidine kinase n=1 Tax=Pontiella desulfatans TaxID=2750659 RepID=A0A6C2UCC8_PONDE|nr:histidine kinase [Pontiella desulfatans]VGO17237.1 Sensor histidine kinase LiaS [Pontiella desulfatans]